MPGKLKQARRDIKGVINFEASRQERFMSRRHLVIPVVALVEGVLTASNAPGPELALASEFGKYPDSWDGRPVVMNHPKDGSASTPEILERAALGMLFNTFVEDGKLKSEIWVDIDRTMNMSDEIQETVTRLKSGEIVEVSIGAHLDIAPGKGMHNGEAYDGIWTNVVPDHLALLSVGLEGACSIEDGCGTPRLNAAGEIEMEGTTLMDGDRESSSISPFHLMMNKLRSMLQFRAGREFSDTDRRNYIADALTQATKDPFIWMVAVFEGVVVYETGDFKLLQRSYSMDESGNVTLEADVEEVRPVTEFIPINAEEKDMTKAERVKNLIECGCGRFSEADRESLEKMSEEQLVTLEAASKVMADALPKQSEGSEDPVIKALEIDAAKELEASKETVKEELTDAPVTAEAYIAGAPEEMREMLGEGLKTVREEKSRLVQALSANDKCDFASAELQAMPIDDLRRMAKMAQMPDYSGQAASSDPLATAESTGIPPTEPVFDLSRRVAKSA